MNFLLNFDNDFCVVILDGDHGEAVRESGVECRLHSGGINGGRRFRPWSPVFVLPAIEGQGDGGGAVWICLGLQFPPRIFNECQGPEGRGPGGGVQHLHQGGSQYASTQV